MRQAQPLSSMPPRLLCALVFCILVSSVAATSSNETLVPHLICEDVREALDKCQFVKDYCQEDRLGYIDYLELYYCSVSPVVSGLTLTGVICWLCILFMIIGVAASDYLCPNLNTISKMLGLSESLAGVTFLALGNGSPDVFSTYAAMKIGSGSLAIGELIGAASFITAVVTGSMAIIRPFKVARKSFLRDVVFFTVAVAFSMYFISDGVLTSLECAIMLLIYFLYVFFVVGWHWYNSRKRHLYLVETRARDLYTELGHEANIEADEEITDNPSLLTQGLNFAGFNSPTLSPVNDNGDIPNFHDSPLTPVPAWQDQSEEEQEGVYNELTRIMRLRRNTHQFPDTLKINSMSHSSGGTAGRPIRPSLFGAMEFRNVLQNLQNSRTNNTLNIPLQSTSDGNFEEQPSSYRDEIVVPSSQTQVPELIVTSPQASDERDSFEYSPTEYERAVSPGLERYSDNPASPFISESSGSYYPPTTGHHLVNFPGRNGWNLIKERLSIVFAGWGDVIVTLCPTLAGLDQKSWVNWVMCILTAPAIFLLTVTVPVIEADAIEKEEPDTQNTNPDDPFLAPVKAKLYIPLVRWLVVLQAILGPLFVAWSGFGDSGVSFIVLLVYSSTVSIVLLLLIFFLIPESTRAPYFMQVISFSGFVFAISWVSIVANEVVGILKALGVIFHISDAVLGLTVFAVGNSLGDLVANMTVAKMGFPMMALSACFGGPMLNILVGVGVSGLVVMPDSSGYQVELSHTLVISGITLLLTLVFLLVAVPLNKWRLSRTLGIITVLFWIIATTVNVILEVAISK